MTNKTWKFLCVVLIDECDRREEIRKVEANSEHQARRKLMEQYLKRGIQVQLITNKMV